MENDIVKMINATYKLLDCFPDHDPLKQKAKEKALAILENLTLVKDAGGWTSVKKEKASAELLDDIEIMKNYLKLGKYQGWITGINFLILLKEYESLKSQIKPPGGNVKLSVSAAVKTPVIERIRSSHIQVVQHSQREVMSLPLQTLPPEELESSGKARERQRKILEIISNRGKAQVADIIKEIPNITKRTIRRDLDELLKKSKVVRNGEWNKVFYQMG